MATGTLTLAATLNLPNSKAKAYVFDWTCDATGDVDQSITDLIGRVDGRIVAVETSPGASGDRATDLPTALYDVYCRDEYACDIAGSALMNRSGTVAERVNPTTPIPIWSPLTLIVDNAGVSKKGRIIFVMQQNQPTT